MKFPKFTKSGIVFNYHSDILLFLWSWGFRSLSLFPGREFSALSGPGGYWETRGAFEKAVHLNSKRVSGHNMTELVECYVRVNYWDSCVVVFSQIDVQEKAPTFWRRVPTDTAKEFLSDVVVLRCRDRAEVIKLLESTSSRFATATGYVSGGIIGSNR